MMKRMMMKKITSKMPSLLASRPDLPYRADELFPSELSLGFLELLPAAHPGESAGSGHQPREQCAEGAALDLDVAGTDALEAGADDGPLH